MTLAQSLRGAARTLITKFGNTVSIYTYEDAVKTESDEGGITISDWTHIQYEQSYTATAGQVDFTVDNIPITSVEEVTINTVATTAYTRVLATGVITLDVGANLNDDVVITYKIDNPAVSVKAVDGDNAKAVMTATNQALEVLGDDQKIFRDDAVIAINDRITADGIDYKVTEIQPVRTQDTLVITTVTMIRVTDTTNW